MAHIVGLADEVAHYGSAAHSADYVNIRLHQGGAALTIFVQKLHRRDSGIDNHVVHDRPGNVRLDRLEVIGCREPIGLAGLGHHIAHVDLGGARAAQRFRYAAHQKIRRDTRVGAARPEHNDVGQLDGFQDFLRRLREKQAALATEILERDDVSHEELEQLRAMFKLVKTLLAMPEQDEACFLKTLSQRG